MLSIPQNLDAQADAAIHKAGMLETPGRFAITGMLAGVYMGIGVVLMLSTAGPLLEADGGLGKLVSGLVFGVALTLTVFAGADLATSGMMTLPIGSAMGAIAHARGALTLLVTVLLNLLGAILWSALIAVSGVLHANPAAEHMMLSMLESKAHESPIELLARGVLCNMLVCLAIWMSSRVTNEVAKIILIFAAIFAFISSGFEHVIANMTTYSIGLFTGAEHATIALFANNVLWVGLGNLIGGAIIGYAYWIVGGSPKLAKMTAGELAAN